MLTKLNDILRETGYLQTWTSLDVELGQIVHIKTSPIQKFLALIVATKLNEGIDKLPYIHDDKVNNLAHESGIYFTIASYVNNSNVIVTTLDFGIDSIEYLPFATYGTEWTLHKFHDTTTS